MNAVWDARPSFSAGLRFRRAGEGLALVGLILLACSAFFKVSYANVALLLLLSGTVLSAAHAWRVLHREPLFWIAVAFGAYVLSYALLWPVLPDSEVSSLRAAGHGIKGTFLPAVLVGYWFYRWPGLVVPLLLLLPLGLLLRVLVALEPGDLERLASGDVRATFGDSAVHFGIWMIVILLCGVWALTRALQRHGMQPRAVLLLLFGLGIASFALTGALFSQSRTAWALGALLVPVFWLLLVLPETRPSLRPTVAATGLMLFVGVLLVAWLATPGLLQARWLEMQHALPVLFSRHWADAPLDSLGFRLRMFHEGWLAWLERPWFGWGPGAESALLANPRQEAIAQFDHFHNNVLSMLTELGVLGGVFFLLVFALPGYYAFMAWRRRDTHSDVALLALFCLLLLFGAAMGDNILTSYRGPFVIALFSGLAFGIQLRHRARSVPSGRAAGHG